MNPAVLALVCLATWAAVLLPVFALYRRRRRSTVAPVAVAPPALHAPRPADLREFASATQPYQASPVTVEGTP